MARRVLRLVGVLVASALIATAMIVLVEMTGMNLVSLAE